MLGLWMISLLVAVSCCGFISASPAAIPFCDVGYYYSTAARTCLMCTTCPVNQIIQQPCTASDDTKCGYFYQFEFFNRYSSDPRNLGQNTEKVRDEAARKQLNLFKIEAADDREPAGEYPNTLSSTETQDTRPGPSLHQPMNKWRELCYGLIAALVLLASVFAVYVIIAQVQINRLQRKLKAEIGTEKAAETVYCYSSVQLPLKPSSNSRFHRNPLFRPIYKPSRQQPPRGIANLLSKKMAAAASSKCGENQSTTSNMAAPNEYVLQNVDESRIPSVFNTSALGVPAEMKSLLQHGVQNGGQQSTSRLLPVIPESSGIGDSDHVRVLYK